MHRLLFIIAFTLATYGLCRAQNFDYSVTTDSVAWNELNAQTILNSGNSAWNFDYRIPIGFTFSYCGRTFDSLTIETNGYIVFDKDRNYALTAFSGVGDCVDTTGTHAMLGYELTGTAGNRILKIQYKNCGALQIGHKTQSWQVWLKENGSVEFRIGPGSLRCCAPQEVDTTQKFRLGLLNMNMDTEERGLLLGGHTDEPEAQPINNSHPEAVYLHCIPAMGYRYTFTPSN
jgi:hypothetical protein